MGPLSGSPPFGLFLARSQPREPEVIGSVWHRGELERNRLTASQTSKTMKAQHETKG